ncbi:MAG: hypothetical protein WDN46_08710 [Methylocella sp.]
MNIIEAIDDERLLGSAIRDPESWRPWRALLAALFGLPLDSDGAGLFRQCTGRAELPSAAFGFLWLAIGRRGGKTFAMAVMAVYIAVFKDWADSLSPGERAVVLSVAADREQAKILRRYISGILSSPILSQHVESETADSIELRGNVIVEVVTCSYRTTRGRSVCCALLDEVAFWRSEGSASPDFEVFTAIRASMATFGDEAMMVIASSPYSRRGLLWDAHRKYYGKNDPRNLFWQAATRVMNPSVPQSFIDAEFERDAASAAAEYGAAFRTDLEAFVSRDVIDSCIEPDCHEIGPQHSIGYVGFVDAAGGSGSDSMAMAVAHAEGEVAVLDCLRGVKPPFSPESVVADFAETLKRYGIRRVTADRWGSEFVTEAFMRHGIVCEQSAKPKSDLYRELPLLNSSKARLLDHPVLIAELCNLERRTARGGRDSIDHPPSQHDDYANSCSGALTQAVSGQRSFRRASIDAAFSADVKPLRLELPTW